MSSTSRLSTGGGTGRRRRPTQARAGRRVAGLLDAAAAVIAESGYEAATLTAVAGRAGASIGSLYQYFPDKPAVARALAERYGAELADRWEPLVAGAASVPLDRLVDRMFDVVLTFLRDRPAFLPLLAAPADYQHAPADRDRLRGHVAALLRAHRPSLPPAEAARVAEVTVQIIKGMGLLFARRPAGGRHRFAAEFKLAISAYLAARLPPPGDGPGAPKSVVNRRAKPGPPGRH